MESSSGPPRRGLHGTDDETAFAVLAQRPCSQPERLLLSLAAEFRLTSWSSTLEELDEVARPLFGIARLEPERAAERLVQALTVERGVTADPRPIDGLFLDRVVSTGVGHPILIAFLFCAVARRAGLRADVYSGRAGWYAGLPSSQGVILIAAGPAPPVAGHDAGAMRSHCGHELAYGALAGLARRYDAFGSIDEAAHARWLMELLPLEPGRGAHPG